MVYFAASGSPLTPAVTTGANALALGNNANAGFAGSSAVGNGATTSRTNQVKLGGTGSSVTVGDLAASTAAQTGASRFMVTTDAGGTLGQGVDTATLATTTALAATNANVATNTANITSLQSLTSTQGGQITSLFALNSSNNVAIKKANEGVAMALAMESPSLPAGTNFGLSGGFGYFEHRTAGTIAMAARIGTNASISAGVGIGFNSGTVGARGGFQVAW